MRRLAVKAARPVAAAILALTVCISAGCGHGPGTPPSQPSGAVPVTETDWRNHLSLPAGRVTRNWVLPDNTMLVELEYNSDGLGDTPQIYGYEVYDPMTDSARIIVPKSHSMIRKVDDKSAEFVCDNMRGLPHLEVYDIGTRKVTPVYPAYPVNAGRQFGVSNAWMSLTHVSVVDGGIDLTLYGAYQAPWMKVSGDESSRTLEIELPGISAEKQVFGSLEATGLAYVESAVAEPSDDGARPGAVIRIRVTAESWERLSYSVATSTESDTHVTVRLCEDAKPTDLSFIVEPPKSWADWRENTIFRRSGIGTSERLIDGILLVGSRAGGYGYGVCDPETCAERQLVGGDSVLASVTPDEVRFLCTGEGAGAVRRFPYYWIYDIATRSLASQEIDLSLATPVEVGGSSFTYGAATADAKGITFSFREGPVMAGGGGPPTARTWADEGTHSFFVEFPDAVTDGLAFGPLDLTAAPFVQAASLSAGVRGEDGATAPGVTLKLTLDAANWPVLTYHIDSLPDPSAPKPDYGYSILVLSFSDQKPAADISGLQDSRR